MVNTCLTRNFSSNQDIFNVFESNFTDFLNVSSQILITIGQSGTGKTYTLSFGKLKKADKLNDPLNMQIFKVLEPNVADFIKGSSQVLITIGQSGTGSIENEIFNVFEPNEK